MNIKTQGFLLALLSSCSFGLMGLFSVPCQKAGMDTLSIIIYRYAIGSAAMLLMLLIMRKDLRISLGDFWRLQLLALFNNLTAFALIKGFELMPSGAATTIQFSYPVFTCIIMAIFFRERITARTVIVILLAFTGVACISGIGGDMSKYPNFIAGMLLELLAGLCYATYLVLVPNLKVSRMPGSKLTFYIFLCSTMQLIVIAPLQGGIAPVPSLKTGIDLALLGLIPTVVSNYTVVLALKYIGSTLTAILGAVEPLTAMTVGVIVFSDPFTPTIAFGAVAIIVAVILLVLKDNSTQKSTAEQPD